MEKPDIVISWDEWKRGREAKRAILRRLGLDKPCRRSESSSDKRLRPAFGGERGPAFAPPPGTDEAALDAPRARRDARRAAGERRLPAASDRGARTSARAGRL